MNKNLHKKMSLILVIAMIFTLAIPMSVSAAEVDLQFTPTPLTEKSLADAEAGTFSVDAGITATYTLTGTGNNNDKFQIVGNKLTIKAPLAVGTYTVKVTADDNAENLDQKTETFTITVAQAKDGTISGDSTLEDAPLNVRLPTSLRFAIDPFELSKDTVADVNAYSQIWSGANGYTIANNSGIAVEVGFTITATLNNDVELVGDASVLEPDNSDAKQKALYFAAQGAEGLAGTAYDYTKGGISGTIAPFDPLSNTASIAFILQKADLTDSENPILATGNAGVAAFRFTGTLNTYATWAANDVTVSGAYTLKPLRTSTYDTDHAVTTSGGKVVDGSLNMKAAEQTNAPISNAAFTAITTTASAAISNADTKLVVFFNMTTKPDAVTSVTHSSTNPVANSYDNITGFLTLTITADDAGTYFIVADGKTYTLNVAVVTPDLTIAANGDDSALAGADIVVALTGKPAITSATLDGNALAASKYTYNAASGLLTIDATDAAAGVYVFTDDTNTYTLTLYSVTIAGNGTGIAMADGNVVVKLTAGLTFTGATFNAAGFTDYNYDDTTGFLTISAAKALAGAYVFTAAGGDTYTLTLS